MSEELRLSLTLCLGNKLCLFRFLLFVTNASTFPTVYLFFITMSKVLLNFATETVVYFFVILTLLRSHLEG